MPDSTHHAVVYVANADSHDISVLGLNTRDGHSTPVETGAVTGRVMPLAVSPDGAYLYAALRSEPYAVSGFAIASDSGWLTPAQTAPLADNMCYLSTDRSGRYLFGASYSGNTFSINAIGLDGQVDPRPLAVIATGKNAHAVATDPSNRFLFVSCLGDDVILQYRFDEANGTVTPNEPAAVETRRGAGPRHFVFHPNRRWVFGINELDGTVNTYRFAVSGTLTLVHSTSLLPDDFTGKPWAADIHLTPGGRFLYASERTSSTLAAFGVDGDGGALTPIGHYATETQPRGFQIDPTGAFLLAVGETSHGLSTYRIDQESGTLERISRHRVGASPNWVEIVALPSRSRDGSQHAESADRHPDPGHAAAPAQ